MPKSGESTTGEGKTGDGFPDVIGPGVTDLSIDAQSPAMAYGIAAPTTDLSITGQAPDLQYVLGMPATTLRLTPQEPAASGTGSTSIGPGVTTLAVALIEPQVGYNQFAVSGTILDVVSVRLTPEELSLDVRARNTDAKAVLDELDSNAGAFDTRERADGTIQNRDTAAGANSYTVEPPVIMDPPRTTREWLVDNVTRDRTSSDTEAIAATVTLVPAATRDPVEGYADAADSDLWEFDFGSSGQVVTASVANIQQGETSAIELVLTPPQAELVETVTGAIAGAITFTVPDGDTFTRDETPDDRQTVTITPPSSASDPAIPADTYVVTGWESRGSDGGGYRLTLNISTRYE